MIELFGENCDEDGEYIYNYNLIEGCKIHPETPEWIIHNINKLWEEERISNLNDWFLVCEGESEVWHVMPKSTNDISFKVLTTITRSGKGLYSTKCKAVWHSLNSKEFRELFPEQSPTFRLSNSSSKCCDRMHGLNAIKIIAATTSCTRPNAPCQWRPSIVMHL